MKDRTVVDRMVFVATLAVGLFAMAVHADEASNERFMKVMSSGELVVGVKADYKPWGFRNSDGEIVGMEVDLAKDVAETLGVQLKLVAVSASNRMQFLEQGKIDLLIATMANQADRRKLIGIPQPNYYSSGTNVLARKGAVKEWSDLSGKPVCGTQGAFYNKQISERYGANIIAFVGAAEGKQALRDKKCIAWVYDDSSIMADLASGSYDEFEMPLQTEDATPWGLAVPLEELDGVWGNFMSGKVYNWHRTGQLIELEKKWGIQPTAYLEKMHKALEGNEPE